MIAQNNFGVLKLIMTPQDLKQIGSLIETKFGSMEKMMKEFGLGLRKMEVEIIALGSRLALLEKKVGSLEDSLLDWKSEIISAVDVMAGEIHSQREFREITTGQIVENSERTDRLERKVFGVLVG